MSIPMTGLVYPMNHSTNRVRRWLFLGLLGAFTLTWLAWEQIWEKGSETLAGLANVGDSGPVGAANPESERAPAREDAVLATATSPDRADGVSIESRVALKPVPAAEARTDSRGPDLGTPIARALAAIEGCQLRYREVRDYTCLFNKRERINGKLSPVHIMMMKVRTNPNSVYFKFHQPAAGREAIYISGRNDGKVLAHDVGLGRLIAGTLSLDPKGGRAMEDCRHPISEAGIGPLLETLEARWSSELDPSESVVNFRYDQNVGDRRCTMIETTHPIQQPEFLFYRVRLFIDDELNLPIHFEAYDWPRSPQVQPELVEKYTYGELKLNVGLGDLDFDVANENYDFGRF